MENTMSKHQPEQNRVLDWMTALSPVLLMAFIYYRWPALVALVSAVGGYLLVSVACRRLALPDLRLAPAMLSGMVIACCLPATTPFWVAVLAGAVAAGAVAVPAWLTRVLPFACPVLVAPLVGYLAVRWVFAGFMTDYTMPVQWAADAVSSATPLATLGNPEASVGLTRLFLGVHAGAMGEGCVPVLLLAGVYLLLRRRLRLIAPGGMLLTVLLLSWPVFGSPLESLLSGGVLLAALLLADRAYAPEGWAAQLVAGVVAGGLVVLLRGVAGVDGSAIAVVLTVFLCPVYRRIFRKKEPTVAE